MTTEQPPEVGTTLPELRRMLRTVDLVSYAGATWDWHRLHYDQALVKEMGFEAPVVDGQMFGALLIEQVQDFLGPRCRVTACDFRFSTPVFADQEVVVTGEVTEVAPGDDGTRISIAQSIAAPGGMAISNASTVAVIA